jgi:hypothetical protein
MNETNDRECLERALLGALKAALPELEKLDDECSSQWGYEDPVYRFYHQSFKVYDLQHTTGAATRGWLRS